MNDRRILDARGLEKILNNMLIDQNVLILTPPGATIEIDCRVMSGVSLVSRRVHPPTVYTPKTRTRLYSLNRGCFRRRRR